MERVVSLKKKVTAPHLLRFAQHGCEVVHCDGEVWFVALLVNLDDLNQELWIEMRGEVWEEKVRKT